MKKLSNQKKIINHFKVSKKSPKSNSNTPAKVKRTLNRFNGMTEAEVAQRGLPDYIKHDLDIVFIGINPGLYSGIFHRSIFLSLFRNKRLFLT